MKISIGAILLIVAILVVGTMIWALCTDVRIPRHKGKQLEND